MKGEFVRRMPPTNSLRELCIYLLAATNATCETHIHIGITKIHLVTQGMGIVRLFTMGKRAS